MRLLAVLSLLLGLAAAHAAPQDELAELRERIAELKRELKQAEQSKDHAADALGESEQAISDINRKLHQLAARLRVAQGELRELSARSEAVRTSLVKHRVALERIVRARHAQPGSDSALQIILSGKDPGAIQRSLTYYGHIARARAELIEETRQELTKLDGLTQSSKRKAAELAEIESEQESERGRLRVERDRRKAVLVEVAADVERQRKEMSSLRRNEARLTRVVEELAKLLARRQAQRRDAERRAAAARRHETERAAARSHTPRVAPSPPRESASTEGGEFSRLKGRLRMPAQGELRGRFGSPPKDAGISGNGLFISAAEGTPAHAVASGRVVFAEWLRGFGNLIILDHGDSFMSVYGNNDSLLKQVGDAAGAGEAIAVVGNSGGNAQTGLYFELRYKGKPIDPLAWLAR